MKKFLKIIASLVTLVFTIVLVAFLYVINVDPNTQKDLITQQFEKNTGLALSLNGDIALTFYPWLGVTLEDVVIANSPGFSDSPLLQSQRAEFRVKLLPMLNREYEIDTIHLRGTRINLETNVAGQGNWNVNTPATAQNENAASSEPALNNLVLGGIDIQNAALTFDDRFNNVRYAFEDINISTGELVYGEPVELGLSLNASASQPALSALVNLTGTVIYDLDNERYDLNPLNLTSTLSGANVPNGSADIAMTTAISLDFAQNLLTLRDFSLTAPNTQINANINGQDFLGSNPVYQINLAAAGTDLAVIFRILENEALVNQISGLNSKSFSLNGLFESSPAQGSLTVSGLDASLLDATITGDISATNLQSGTPIINGTINASGPDLPTLLEVAGQLQGGSDSPLARYGRDLQQSPDQTFLLNTRFDANLETGNINVPELEARALGAVISGNITASNMNTESPVFRGRLNASGPDLPLLMQIAGQLSQGRESSLNEYGRQLRNSSNKNFSINAPFDVDMASGNIDVTGLQASFLGFRLSGELQANNFQSANGIMAGELNLTGRNMAEILTALEQSDLAEVVQSLNLTVGVNGPRNNLSLNPFNLDLILAGPRIPNSSVTLALDSNILLNLEGETLTTESFSLAGLGLNLQGSVNARNIMSDPIYNGQVSLPNINLRRFMQQINQQLPATMDNSVFQTFALASAFSGSSNDLSLSNLDLTLDDSRFNGELALADFDNLAVDFDLSINSINLDRYLAPNNGASVNSSDLGNTELPVDSLRDLNLKGELNIGQLTYSDLNLNDLALSINASDGQLVLAPISANLYQGTYTGDIRLNVNNDIPSASVDTTLTGINLAPLLQDFMDASYVSGFGDIQLSLSGRGADTATIKRNLNGKGSLALQDGVLEGVDVGSVLNQVEAMIREQRPRTIARGERTPFDSFSSSITVNNGIVTTDDLLIESSGFDVSGRGTLVNLANDSIAFNMVANVDQTPASDEQAYDIGGYSLPIACSGLINSPTCLPDIQSILAGAIRSAVQRGLSDLIQRAIGDEVTEGNGTGTESTTATEPEEEIDPRQELLNRALENLFNR